MEYPASVGDKEDERGDLVLREYRGWLAKKNRGVMIDKRASPKLGGAESRRTVRIYEGLKDRVSHFRSINIFPCCNVPYSSNYLASILLWRKKLVHFNL